MQSGDCAVFEFVCQVFRDAITWAVVPKYDCPQCGPYMMSDAAYSEFRHSNLHKGFVSGSIRRMAQAADSTFQTTHPTSLSASIRSSVMRFASLQIVRVLTYPTISKNADSANCRVHNASRERSRFVVH